MHNKNKGITLVALVITIIILLILAGVAISALTQTGLFDNAKQAKNATENAQNKEEGILNEYEKEIAGYGNGEEQQDMKFSLRAFKKPLLTEEEYQLLSYLQREGDVSCHLKCLKEEAKSREPNLADSRQEQIQREFISRVAQLYYKKQLVIDNIRREDCLEANGTSVLAQAV